MANASPKRYWRCSIRTTNFENLHPYIRTVQICLIAQGKCIFLPKRPLLSLNTSQPPERPTETIKLDVRGCQFTPMSQTMHVLILDTIIVTIRGTIRCTEASTQPFTTLHTSLYISTQIQLYPSAQKFIQRLYYTPGMVVFLVTPQKWSLV